MRLSDTDHGRVSTAVRDAEAATAGEIVVVVAAKSDAYHDVGLHYAVLAMLLVAAAGIAWPGTIGWVHARIEPWADAPSLPFVLTTLVTAQMLAFLILRYACAWQPLRMALTPAATRARRVRRQALTLFRAAAEKRTVAATGVLLYLSLAEHRAELIADAAIHDRVAPEVWGDTLAALLGAMREGRTADGIVTAVGAIGTILAQHFPQGTRPMNELPDRVIEL